VQRESQGQRHSERASFHASPRGGGYSVTRAAASLGAWDIIAISSKDVALIQVKTRDWPGLGEMETLRGTIAPLPRLPLIGPSLPRRLTHTDTAIATNATRTRRTARYCATEATCNDSTKRPIVRAVGTSSIPRRSLIALRSVSPEAQLAIAMIERALDDLAGRRLLSTDLKRSRAHKAQREARRWIAGASASLTFETACMLAGLEVKAVREKVLEGWETLADHPSDRHAPGVRASARGLR